MLGLGLSITQIAVRQLLGFAPSSLFANGEQGVWYDPSDTATLFQDAAGTTPVTAVEQPVGLMLDKSKGLVLGSELVTNGDFSNGTTGWTGTDATLSVDTGRLKASLTAFRGGASTAVAVTPNTWQKVSLTFVSGPAGALLQVGTAVNDGTYFQRLNSPTGTYTFYINPAVSTVYISLRGDFTTGDFLFDNISVKQLPGNHAFQATSTSRPVLSARYNLLLNTGFSGAVVGTPGTAPTNWTLAQTGGSITALTPDGAGNNILAVSATAARQLLTQSFSVGANTSYTFICRINANSGLSLYEIAYPTLNVAGTYQFFVNGVSVADPLLVIPAANSEIRCVVTVGATAGLLTLRLGAGAFNAVTGAVSFSLPDLRVTNDALGQSAYQRVNTATDYDATGFKPYLRFDGTDDWLQTNSIDFATTDKMTVFAGVRKIGTADAMILELSAAADSNSGTFYLGGPLAAGSWRYAFLSRGSLNSSASSTDAAYNSPSTDVLTGIGDISGDVATLRIDGIQAATNAANQGTGNYGNYPLYIGRRGGTTLPFNGRLYGLIVRGAATRASQITQTEGWLNQRTGAF